MYKRCAFAVFLLGYANAAPSRCVCLDALSRCLCLVMLRFRRCLVLLRFRRGVCVAYAAFSRWLAALCFRGVFVGARCAFVVCSGPYGYVLISFRDSFGDWHAVCIKEPAVMRATPRAWDSSVRTVTRNATPVCIEFTIRTPQCNPLPPARHASPTHCAFSEMYLYFGS